MSDLPAIATANADIGFWGKSHIGATATRRWQKGQPFWKIPAKHISIRPPRRQRKAQLSRKPNRAIIASDQAIPQFINVDKVWHTQVSRRVNSSRTAGDYPALIDQVAA
jgi:hypothetical protein